MKSNTKLTLRREVLATLEPSDLRAISAGTRWTIPWCFSDCVLTTEVPTLVC